MAEANQYIFSHRELVETLIQKQKLHEGIWTLAFQLGMGAAQVPSPTGGGSGNDTVPAAIVSILAVGLQKADKEGPIALDAAKVNPARK
jgi:hypothetical protein